MTEHIGPVDPHEELIKAFTELEALTDRLASIKARIDQLHKEEEELRNTPAPRTGVLTMLLGL